MSSKEQQLQGAQEPASPESLAQAVKKLKSGELVAIPTETVYGLAAPIGNIVAVKNIFKSKERPLFDPLIVHVASVEQGKSLTPEWWPILDELAANFWPGPLTMVVPKVADVSPIITAGLDTVAIRCPQHQMTVQVLEEVGPCAAPSANRFGRTSPTTAQDVSVELPEVFVLDGGKCQMGIESTILSVEKSGDEYLITILRPGFIGEEDLHKVLQDKFKFKLATQLEGQTAPGQLKNHYQPQRPVVLMEAGTVAGLAASGEDLHREFIMNINEALASNGHREIYYNSFNLMMLDEDGTMAARQLYGELRRLAKEEAFIVVPISDSMEKSQKVWPAILNRLERAASIDLRERKLASSHH